MCNDVHIVNSFPFSPIQINAVACPSVFLHSYYFMGCAFIPILEAQELCSFGEVILVNKQLFDLPFSSSLGRRIENKLHLHILQMGDQLFINRL